jgi:hypothetical protein
LASYVLTTDVRRRIPGDGREKEKKPMWRRRRLLVVTMVMMLFVLAMPASAAAPETLEGAESDDFGSTAEGTSQIRRTANGMSLDFDVEGLTPGNVYSVWWVVFDINGTCAQDNDDFYVLNATGGIANQSGEATFRAHLSNGPVGPANGEDVLVSAPFGEDFLTALDTHVFSVVVDHGARDDLSEGTVAENMRTIIGAVGDVLEHDNASGFIRDNCL